MAASSQKQIVHLIAATKEHDAGCSIRIRVAVYLAHEARTIGMDLARLTLICGRFLRAPC